MTAHTTLSCDGKWCGETASERRAAEEGWCRSDGHDLCPRCSTFKCAGTVGRRPEWMSPGQYDACLCVLVASHDGPHRCKHDEADASRCSDSAPGQDVAS